MYWLGMDLETTGLSRTESYITEIGAVIWDVENKCPVSIYSGLIKIPISVSPIITKITGITDELLEKFGHPAFKVLMNFASMFEHVDYVMAHNGNSFDKPLLFNRCDQESVSIDKEKPWIDSQFDIPYTSNDSRKLKYIAADHNFLNPFPHRAVTDVLTMLTIASRYDPEEIIAGLTATKITLIAKVSKAEKDKAKDVGYKWDRDNFLWKKDILDHKLNEETQVAKQQGFIFEVIK